MRSRGYTLLGWVVWQIASRVIRRRIEANRTKIAAAAVVVAVVAGGVAAARAGGED